MAVSSTATESQTRAVIRTCVGCRQKHPATELLRVTADPANAGALVPVVVDARRRAPGRGAWIHPNLECMALAERRKAFGRALRLVKPVDLTAVRRYIESATS
jgi:predicted RNA-binding protein YlxR (DUF448 family)